MGYKLDLKNPKTFSEKLQWLKLYDRRPEYTIMVDKVKAKEYVANKIGEQYIIPTIGVWKDPEEIDFELLPNQFVLKCNHNSGGLFICKDKTKVTPEKWADVKKKLRDSLHTNYYLMSREWPYKNVPRRILAEKYMEAISYENGHKIDLKDYKFFCFGGEPKYCQVIGGRETKMVIDFFDENWNHQPFHEPHDIPFADVTPAKPKNYEEMRKLAAILSEDKPFSRIDFYDINGKIYFGEITFFPTAGMGGFYPEEWDRKFGDLILLPSS